MGHSRCTCSELLARLLAGLVAATLDLGTFEEISSLTSADSEDSLYLWCAASLCV